MFFGELLWVKTFSGLGSGVRTVIRRSEAAAAAAAVAGEGGRAVGAAAAAGEGGGAVGAVAHKEHKA